MTKLNLLGLWRVGGQCLGGLTRNGGGGTGVRWAGGEKKKKKKNKQKKRGKEKKEKGTSSDNLKRFPFFPRHADRNYAGKGIENFY